MSTEHNIEPCDKHEISNCGLCKEQMALTITQPRNEIGRDTARMSELGTQRLARDLMNQHGLSDWKFALDNARRRFGCCHSSRKMITLSRHLVVLNGEAEVRNCILHEIAHAIAGHRAGHGPEWKRVAASIGCDARRCYDSETIETPDAPIMGTCPACGKEFPRHRMPKHAGGLFHSKCPKGAQRTPKQYITWRRVG
jgi:predicted SprT family Zn-dependent metalloprotease